ncbi:hypothetical protein SCLCIDRAFT_1224182 [Scleroderma citrinum Foug A]|uniref:Uncharacterized protein n=1 Tax=Scleroderma citrinum Foug A TaxID=1036808 RepID=A0A0C3D6M4_9AGAM|nr:hypothetical protein SCLCIDRAFT_1224182 [Scleroderma citrinum Foug A]
MCLREDGSQGFPPPDSTLRTFLLSAADPSDNARTAKQLHAFMYSLLSVTHERLQAISTECGYLLPTEDVFANVPRGSRESLASVCTVRQNKMASVFRDRMTSGQSFKASNRYRLEFYDDVINRATQDMNHCEEQKGAGVQSPSRYIFQGRGVKEAGERLCRLIDPQHVLDSPTGPRRPLVVISFDESHILTDNPRDERWTLFSELRRVLRGMVDLPVFSLFLSTAGRFHRFTPEKRLDPSGRIANSILCVLHPISEISFDDIAFPASEDTVMLDRVVEMDWISHLGRPLFGTRYDALSKDRRQPEVMVFAKQKLLGGSSITLQEDNKAGILACLSVRFALEFNADANALAVACAQVERHMRLCITATSRLEKLVTLAGSEPLLAEAACDLLKQASMDPVRHLAKHSDLNCIDRGRRGELIAAFILMQARDKAAVGRRWMSVCEFMEALLPSAAYEKLLCTLPKLWRREDKPFNETFEDYRMWFNHVIRIEDATMIEADSLWKFITRGAMVVCKHNQFGVDIVLPACVAQEKLSRHTITAILIQVKNDKRYTDTVKSKLFDAMDPFLVGLFPKEQSSRPVIRVVFALASPKSVVVIPPRRTREPHYYDDFTAFDVWCAGLSSDTFRHIGDDVTPYKDLLERSLQPHDAFNLKEIDEQPPVKEDMKLMRGLRRRRMAALVMAEDGHSSIHSP